MINNYEVFVSIVKLGSYSAAAKQLHKSPSAISKQITLLEQTLGVQLFDRTTRSLKMTEAGELYYSRALDIVRRIKDAETELKELAGEPSGRIRVTFPNALSSSPIIKVMSLYANQYPKVTFDINVSIEKKSLIDDDFDFAFRMGPLEDSGMVAVKLFEVSPRFCASPSFIAKHSHPRTIKELLELPILIPNNLNMQRHVKMLEPTLDWGEFKHIHTGVDVATFVNLARQGFAASLCFEHMVSSEFADGSLIDITPPKLRSPLPIYLVYQNYQYMPVKHRCFVDTFKQAFSSEQALTKAADSTL